MNGKMKPALIGGLVAGVLSVIPVVSFCSCLWAIGGGVLAGYLLIKDSAVPVSISSGAVAGLLTGVVAGVLRLIIGIPVSLVMMQASNTEEQLRRLGVQLPVTGTVLLICAGIFGALVIAGLSTIGGLISVPLFEKRTGADEPPPPPVGFAA